MNRLLATAVAAFIFFNQVVFAYQIEKSIWVERQVAALPLASVPILQNPKVHHLKKTPSAYLNPGSSFHFPSETHVTIIQDIHLNREAQTNIIHALQSMIDAQEVDLVAMEGAFEKFNFKPFRTLEEKNIVKDVADTFLHENKIGGPSYVGITSEVEPPPFIGIDDLHHYQANVEAIRQAEKFRPALIKKIVSLKNKLEHQKKEAYGNHLLILDKFLTAYQNEEISLGLFIKNLLQSSTNKLEMGWHTTKFLEASDLEKSLNFSRVELQRQKLLMQVSKELSKKELDHLILLGQAYQNQETSQAEFYGFLQGLLVRNGISLTSYPDFHDYLQYTFLSDEIDGAKLLEEVQDLTVQIFSAAAKSDREKELVQKSRQLFLCEKLVNFSLSPAEWKQLSGIYKRGDSSPLQIFENFYDEAEIRSEKMVENLLRASTGVRNVVMVSGGFHTPHISHLLKEKRISHSVVTPKISKVESGTGTSYLSVFTQKKAPLEKLFDGETLFVYPRKINIGSKGPQDGFFRSIVNARKYFQSGGAGVFKNTFGGITRFYARLSQPLAIGYVKVGTPILDIQPLVPMFKWSVIAGLGYFAYKSMPVSILILPVVAVMVSIDPENRDLLKNLLNNFGHLRASARFLWGKLDSSKLKIPIELKGVFMRFILLAQKKLDPRMGWIAQSVYGQKLSRPTVLLSMEGRISRFAGLYADINDDGSRNRITSNQGGLGDLFGGWIAGLADLGGVTNLNPDEKLDAPEFFIFIPNYISGVRHSRVDEYGWPIPDSDDRSWMSVRPQDHGIEKIRDPQDQSKPFEVDIPVPKIGLVKVQFRAVEVGNLKVVMPETDANENPEARDILKRLYQGELNSEVRLRQEWIYGLAAYEFKKAFGDVDGPVHLNETATFAYLIGLLRGHIESFMEDGLDYETAYELATEKVGAQTVFFTHTLVAAGVDKFYENVPLGDYIREYFEKSRLLNNRIKNQPDAWEVTKWVMHGKKSNAHGKFLPGFDFEAISPFTGELEKYFSPLNWIIRNAYEFNGSIVAVSKLNSEKAGDFLTSPEQPILTQSEIQAKPVQHVTNAVDHLYFSDPEIVNALNLDDPDPTNWNPEGILNPADPQAHELRDIVKGSAISESLDSKRLVSILSRDKKNMVYAVRARAKDQIIRNLRALKGNLDNEDALKRYEFLVRRWEAWTGEGLPVQLDEIENFEPKNLLDENKFTVAWARRIVEYKRMLLIVFGEYLPEVEKELENIIQRNRHYGNSGQLKKDFSRFFQTVIRERRNNGGFDQFIELTQKMQFIFAGPTFDTKGRAMVALLDQVIATLSEEHPSILNSVIYVEGYNDVLSQYFVRGSDVWLNTPRRPEEASGTSGMKGSAVNLTVRDGWAADGLFPGLNGLAIGPPQNTHPDHPANRNNRPPAEVRQYLIEEAQSLYGQLGLAYDMFNSEPESWLNLVRRSIYYKLKVFDVRGEFTGRWRPSSDPEIKPGKDPSILDFYATANSNIDSLLTSRKQILGAMGLWKRLFRISNINIISVLEGFTGTVLAWQLLILLGIMPQGPPADYFVWAQTFFYSFIIITPINITLAFMGHRFTGIVLSDGSLIQNPLNREALRATFIASSSILGLPFILAGLLLQYKLLSALFILLGIAVGSFSHAIVNSRIQFRISRLIELINSNDPEKSNKGFNELFLVLSGQSLTFKQLQTLFELAIAQLSSQGDPSRRRQAQVALVRAFISSRTINPLRGFKYLVGQVLSLDEKLKNQHGGWFTMRQHIVQIMAVAAADDAEIFNYVRDVMRNPNQKSDAIHGLAEVILSALPRRKLRVPVVNELEDILTRMHNAGQAQSDMVYLELLRIAPQLEYSGLADFGITNGESFRQIMNRNPHGLYQVLFVLLTEFSQLAYVKTNLTAILDEADELEGTKKTVYVARGHTTEEVRQEMHALQDLMLPEQTFDVIATHLDDAARQALGPWSGRVWLDSDLNTAELIEAALLDSKGQSDPQQINILMHQGTVLPETLMKTLDELRLNEKYRDRINIFLLDSLLPHGVVLRLTTSLLKMKLFVDRLIKINA